jgi:hypothetical protein
MNGRAFNADYFCTWELQRIACDEQGKENESGEIAFIGDQGASTTREAITEHTVFGKNGWIHIYPEDRKDLFFLLDDGWDVDYFDDYKDAKYSFGSHDVCEKKFPSFKGTPDEKLKQMVERVKAAYPNATAFATTLRQVINPNTHLWGAIANVDGNWQVVEPREIGVLDRIGGGDGFVGGFLYSILKGWEPEKWIQFGWATGALATTHLTDYAQPADEEQVWSIWSGNARVKR